MAEKWILPSDLIDIVITIVREDGVSHKEAIADVLQQAEDEGGWDIPWLKFNLNSAFGPENMPEGK